MNVDIDNKTQECLKVVAVAQNTSPAGIAAELLRHASKYHAERIEDQQRLENSKNEGGIPHADMMNWLDDLATGP